MTSVAFPMVIDSSALLAILLDEPEGPIFMTRIDKDGIRLVSTATLLELRWSSTDDLDPKV